MIYNSHINIAKKYLEEFDSKEDAVIEINNLLKSVDNMKGGKLLNKYYYNLFRDIKMAIKSLD